MMAKVLMGLIIVGMLLGVAVAYEKVGVVGVGKTVNYEKVGVAGVGGKLLTMAMVKQESIFQRSDTPRLDMLA